MKWKVARAKQKFSEVVRASRGAPQLIFNRDRLVAAVVDGSTFESFDAWQKRQTRSLADAASELRDICRREGYRLETPRRSNRPNTFADARRLSR